MNLYEFIAKTWGLRDLEGVLKLITQLEAMGEFESLQIRFSLWRKAISNLKDCPEMTPNSSAPKRVLMIFSNSYDGAYPRDLAHGFYDAGIEIGFISLSKADTPKWINNHFAKDFSTEFGQDLSLMKRITRTITVVRKFKPDIIQAHLFHGGIVGLVVGKLLRIPVIHTRHHIDEHYQSGTFVHRWVDRVVARKSRHVIVCSLAAKNWLVDVESINESHVTIVNQGFDFSYLDPSSDEIAEAAKALEFSKEKLNIVCVARYSKAKGQNYLLHAIRELIGTIPNISLTLMGPGDSSWLHALVEELELERHVSILPSRNDVPACIAAADMIIHPSLADSFSQLVIEAQAVGGLLIASDIAATREQLVDGVTGVIVPPRDSKAIVLAVQHLVNNPDLAATIRKNAPSNVREKFTWQRMVTEEINCLARYTK
jgi:glycosyltransferase involved in cell wall biosynthesis